MEYTGYYSSPLGSILMAADDEGLSGLWFEGQEYFGRGLGKEQVAAMSPILRMAGEWLDTYFSGKEPGFSVPLHTEGTPFQEEVWEILRSIPYGETITYGRIAEMIAGERGVSHMSSQAVGGAVGRNPVSIIIPCHRVIGSDGSLTGYAGGIWRKKSLLELERTGTLMEDP